MKERRRKGKGMTFIEIPEKAERILETLQGAGYEAYVVGGCVRDSILGRTRGTGILRHRRLRSR